MLINYDRVKIETDLIQNSKLIYMDEFLLKGIEDYIKKQRDSQLQKNFYKYISKIWNTFKKSDKWKMVLSNEGVPILRSNNKEYSFEYLSGGEKTSILVITRTLLNKILAPDINFMLLDEPLEHLDSKNRRSLLQFLIDVSHENLVDQLIITTVEQTLLNKFIADENVNIHHLEMTQEAMA